MGNINHLKDFLDPRNILKSKSVSFFMDKNHTMCLLVKFETVNDVHFLFYSQNYIMQLSLKQIRLAKGLIHDGYKLKKFDNTNTLTLAKGKTKISLYPKTK